MISDDFLALLRCPESGQSLAPAPAGLVAQLEAMRAAGRLRDRAGKPCDAPVEAGLVRADGTRFYPIKDGIPILLTTDAVTLPADSLASG